MPVGNPWLPIVTRGAEPQEGGGIIWGLDRRSEVIPRYTNAPMMVFMPKGTVVAIRWLFC